MWNAMAFTNDEAIALSKAYVVSPLLADKVAEQGSHHVQANSFETNARVSDHLVTGQNPSSAAGLAKKKEKLLAEAIHREKAAQDVLDHEGGETGHP